MLYSFHSLSFTPQTGGDGETSTGALILSDLLNTGLRVNLN